MLAFSAQFVPSTAGTVITTVNSNIFGIWAPVEIPPGDTDTLTLEIEYVQLLVLTKAFKVA